MAKQLDKTEIELINEDAQKLVQGFRMFDIEEFGDAVRAAYEANAHRKEIQDARGKPVMAKLVRYVVTSPKREGYGVPFPWWWISFEHEVLKGVDNDPWSESRWWLFEELRGKGKVLTMWGGQNSAKSAFMGRFAIIQMVAWTGDAVVYATGPKKLHSEDKSWADTVEVWAKYLQNHKNMFIAALGIKIQVGKHLVTISDESGSAIAKFVSSEDSSTIRGKKSHSHDTSGLRGITLVLVDEFVENPHLDLSGINQNSSSNYNYFQIMGCNPNPELVQHPNLRDFSFPNKVANLDRTRNFRWETKYGLCVRYAWQNSPNNVIGRTRWPYLLDEIRVERQREKGATAIDAEIDAWGFGSGARGAPLDEARIKLAGTYEEPMWNGPTTRIAVFDCAFGGQDPATAFIAECGPSFFKDRSGGRFTRETIAAIDQIVIPVQQEFEVTADWLDEMEELMAWTGGKWP